jgi:hypothetical protein
MRSGVAITWSPSDCCLRRNREHFVGLAWESYSGGKLQWGKVTVGTGDRVHVRATSLVSTVEAEATSGLWEGRSPRLTSAFRAGRDLSLKLW